MSLAARLDQRGASAPARRGPDTQSPWALAWRLMRTRPRLYAVSMVGWIGFHSLPLTTGLATRWLFDRLPLGRSLGVAFAAIAACEVVRLGVLYLASVSWGANWMILAANLRTNLLDWMVLRRGPSLTPRPTGEQVSRFRDDGEEFIWLIDTWLDVAGTGLFTTAGLVVLFSIDPVLTGVAIAPLTVIVLSTRFFGNRMKEYRRAARRATAMVTGFVGELFSAVQAVKVAGAEEASLTRLRRLGDVRRTAAIRDRVAAEMIFAVNQNAVHLAIALVMVLGASKLRSGELSVGDLTMFFSYVTGTATCARFVGHLTYRHKQAAVAMDRMVRILRGARPADLVVRTELDLDEGSPRPLPARRPGRSDRLDHLEARALTHVFPSSHHGVADVDLVLPAGSFTVVTGPVGSGKSTLLRVLLGLAPDTRGEVRWNGRAVGDREHFFVPPRVAYTPQVPRLFSETILDNVLLGRADPDGRRFGTAVHGAVLEEDLADMERRELTVIGPRGLRLSGGQVQRVAVARMLAQEASLLVFDDVSSALDVDTEAELWSRLVGGEGDGRRPTCLVVSHRPVALRLADQVIVLDDGRVAATGTYREVRGLLAKVG